MDTIMMGLTMIVLALAIPISCAEMFKRWVSYKEAELAARGSSAENKALEARIKVLERIVTDRGHDLAGEIEALRRDNSGAGVPLAFEKERV